MDAVHGLLRTVVRGFYDIRAVIVLDTLLTHHVLSDRELVTATGIPAKDVRATCARLREDHILTEIQHKDGGVPGMRAYTQTVYYIHFTEAVDAVKWKMHVVENKLREELDHKHNAQDYKCDVCGAKYETMDALTLFDPETQQFLCGTCNNPLKEEESRNAFNSTTSEPIESEQDNQMEDFMVQLKPLIAQLKKIDETTIPENSFESELEQHVPLIGADTATSTAFLFPEQVSASHGNGQEREKDLTIAGSASSRLPQHVQSTFKVNITSEAEERSLQQSEIEEKKRISQENALPEWHAHSTVDGMFNAFKTEDSLSKPKTEHDSEQLKPAAAKQADSGAEDAMQEYFRKLQQQQEATATNDASDPDDEDEFEDIV